MALGIWAPVERAYVLAVLGVTPSDEAGRGGALDLGSRRRCGRLATHHVTPSDEAGRRGAWDLGSRWEHRPLAPPGRYARGGIVTQSAVMNGAGSVTTGGSPGPTMASPRASRSAQDWLRVSKNSKGSALGLMP